MRSEANDISAAGFISRRYIDNRVYQILQRFWLSHDAPPGTEYRGGTEHRPRAVFLEIDRALIRRNEATVRLASGDKP
jgi:hypothetical protein